MATNRSRKLSISPPPSKRRRVEASIEVRQEFDTSHPENISIYSWNINGIEPFVQRKITSFFGATATQGSAPLASLRAVLRRNGWPTMLFLQEVKINPDDNATQKAVERAVMPTDEESPDEPLYKVFFCLPSDKHNARGFGRKVYGVCSIIREDFYRRCVTEVREVDWDAEGRFLVIEIKATKVIPKLAIFNIYAVNGTDAPYKDSTTGRVVGTRHDRKLQVHKLLQAECRMLKAKGVEVVLAGDLNIARTPLDGFPNLRTFPKQHVLNRADFEARFFQCRGNPGEGSDEDLGDGLDLVDTFRHLNPTQAGYTYYPRGRPFGSSCDRVDMILISPALSPRLVRAGILESEIDRGPSDHVPLYVHLDFGKGGGKQEE